VTTEGQAADAVLSGDTSAEASIGESKWPPAIALLLFMALHVATHLWLPETTAMRVPWIVPGLEAALLLVLVTASPVSAAQRRHLRIAAVTLVGVLVAAALWATCVLLYDLIDGEGVAEEPGSLLASAAVVWLGNNLAFGLLYWLMDAGGPRARSLDPTPVDFAFTQQMSPELAPPAWRPLFLDYLHLGFTNATAFSPTDVMPLTHRAKYAMLVQSTVALALFALVVARAVNAFT
jgi:hypothetical protein